MWKSHDIPVIFISGIDENNLKNNFDYSKCEFVKKPFSDKELLKAVKKFL